MNTGKLTIAGVGAGVLMAGLVQAGGAAHGQSMFNGGYIGTHVGVGGPNASGVHDSGGAAQDLASIVQNGVIGGGQIGWNLQYGMWVFGIEGDVSAIDWGRSALDEEGDTLRLDTDLFSTVRGRFGKTYGNSLAYMTGGLGMFFGDVSVTSTGTGNGRKNISAFGVVFGSGIETFLSDNLSFKVEGLWGIFDDRTSLESLPDAEPGDNFKLEDFFLVRIGFNWHFGTLMQTAGLNVTPAADLDPMPDNRWNGLYGGIHYGYGGLNARGRFDTSDNGGVDISGALDNGILGGGQVGWNFRSGSWVFGVEGDVTLVDWKDRITDHENDTHKGDVDLLATVRGRAGMAVGDALVYGTAGVAFLDADISLDAGGTGPGKRNMNAVGGAFGAGIETFIFENISAKAEGLYMVFDKRRSLNGVVGDADPGDFFKITDGFVFRSGLSYHLPIN